jgi:hypothetical protein
MEFVELVNEMKSNMIEARSIRVEMRALVSRPFPATDLERRERARQVNDLHKQWLLCLHNYKEAYKKAYVLYLHFNRATA